MNCCRSVTRITLLVLTVFQLSCAKDESAADAGAKPPAPGVAATAISGAPAFSLATLPNSTVVAASHNRVAGYASGKEVWSFALPDNDTVAAPPVGAANSTAYIRGAQEIYAIGPDGKLLWSAIHADAAASIKGIVALGDSTVALTAGDNSLVNYDGQGKTRWTFRLPDGDHLTAMPVIAANSTIYLRGGKKLYGLDPQGKLGWQADLATGQ